MESTLGKTIVHFEPHFETWRAEARRLVRRGVDPSSVLWSPDSLASSGEVAPEADAEIPVRVPAAFLEKARYVAHARDPQRWALMYRLLYRVTLEEPDLLDDLHDADVKRFLFLEKAVRREVHRMLAFTHFKMLIVRGEARMTAWCRPEHPVLELVADAFERRMGHQAWSILTPDQCVHSDEGKITFSAGIPLQAFFLRDGFENIAVAHLSALKDERDSALPHAWSAFDGNPPHAS